MDEVEVAKAINESLDRAEFTVLTALGLEPHLLPDGNFMLGRTHLMTTTEARMLARAILNELGDA